MAEDLHVSSHKYEPDCSGDLLSGPHGSNETNLTLVPFDGDEEAPVRDLPTRKGCDISRFPSGRL